MNSMYCEKTICTPTRTTRKATFYPGFDMAYRRMRRRERAKDVLKAVAMVATMALSAALPLAWVMISTIR